MSILWGRVILIYTWVALAGTLSGADVALYQGVEPSSTPYAISTTDADGQFFFEIDPESEGWFWTLRVPGYWLVAAYGDLERFEFPWWDKDNEAGLPHSATFEIRKQDHLTYTQLREYGPIIMSMMSDPTPTPTGGTIEPTPSATSTPIRTSTPTPTSTEASTETPTSTPTMTPTPGPWIRWGSCFIRKIDDSTVRLTCEGEIPW